MEYVWQPTNAKRVARHDDIWFISPEIGWAVNSDGRIIYTKDGGKLWVPQETTPSIPALSWLRCISFAGSTHGWVGAIRPRKMRLWKTVDGKTWTTIDDDILPKNPSAICGICAVNENVVYASGTQYPERRAAILRTENGGQSWAEIDMDSYADLLIDIYFTDESHGWVVGGHGGDSYDRLKPVVLYTANGGKTWENKLRRSGIEFPYGEWGWKIQFLNDQLGFISLENFSAAAILKTTDGGDTWERIEVKDPQGNANLEGIGFLNEMVGWVGGWGAKGRNPPGYSSGTTDGGKTWFNANNIGRFINRFRFTGEQPIIGYASGDTIYQCVALVDDDTRNMLISNSDSHAETIRDEIPIVTEAIEISVDVPENTKQLTITCWDKRGRIENIMADEHNPVTGPRSFVWDFTTPDGADVGTGYFLYRINIDDEVESQLVNRPWRVSPEELGNRVAKMIQSYARVAQRSHGELLLPDENGNSVDLVSLFDRPKELMAAMVRGGWVIPDYPDRSMLLTSIIGIGSNRGPMQDRLEEKDVQLLTDWVEAGAIIPDDDKGT